MKEIPLQGKHGKGHVALVDDDDYAYLMQWHWLRKPKKKGPGYAIRYESPSSGTVTIFMHNAIMGPAPDGKTVDHIDRNSLDNRRLNLGFKDLSAQQHNHGPHDNNTSGFKGVTWHKGAGRWMAQLGDRNKMIYLGLYDTPEQAHRDYEAEKVRRGLIAVAVGGLT